MCGRKREREAQVNQTSKHQCESQVKARQVIVTASVYKQDGKWVGMGTERHSLEEIMPQLKYA